MSLITDDPEHSPRDCSRFRSSSAGNRRRRAALIAVSSTATSLVSLALVMWLTLRPLGPRFSVLAATATVVAGGNTTKVVVMVDPALSAHSPNAHATALYDKLRASASYGGVAIGTGTPLPPLERPDQGDAVLSALLTSGPLPGAGGVLRVRVEGQLRWKVAAWVSARHGLTVDCVAAVVPSYAGQQLQGSSSSPSSQCATNVL